jgi:hypothetical protein
LTQWPPMLLTPTAFSSDRIEDWALPLSLPINFGNFFQLRGVYLPGLQTLPAITNLDGHSGIDMQLYIQTTIAHYPFPINIFIHLLGPDGKEIFVQRDFMGVPASSWQPDLLFTQDGYTAFPSRDRFKPGRYYLSIGAYNVLTGERLPILDSSGKVLGDRLLVAAVSASYLP